MCECVSFLHIYTSYFHQNDAMRVIWMVLLSRTAVLSFDGTVNEKQGRRMRDGNGEDEPSEQQFSLIFEIAHYKIQKSFHTLEIRWCECQHIAYDWMWKLKLCWMNQWVFVFCCYRSFIVGMCVFVCARALISALSSCKTFDMDEMKRSFVG